jgi:hypothetical protein
VVGNVLIFKKYGVELIKKAYHRQSVICSFGRAKPIGSFLDLRQDTDSATEGQQIRGTFALQEV